MNTHILDRKPPIVCRCPYCGRYVTEAQRLRYPEPAAHAFTPVYRCQCNKIIGAPVDGYAGVSLPPK